MINLQSDIYQLFSLVYLRDTTKCLHACCKKFISNVCLLPHFKDTRCSNIYNRFLNSFYH